MSVGMGSGVSLDSGLGIQLATTPPVMEAQAAVIGSINYAAKADHTHQSAVIGAGRVTLDGNGDATITYARICPVGTSPVLLMDPLDTGSQPVFLSQRTDITDGSGNITGATIHGFRSQLLPNSLIVLTVLNSFNASAGGSAAGVVVSYIARMPTS